MSVPGTFKNRPPAPRRMPDAPETTALIRGNGAIHVEYWAVGECSVIVAREPLGTDDSYRWHLSIAHRDRYPKWDEIKTARYAIPTVAEVEFMAQLLPLLGPGIHWTNVHENCFHLYETTPDIKVRLT